MKPARKTFARISILPVVAVVLVLATPAMVFADDSDVIEYRQHIMNTIGEHAAAIDMILKNKAPAENLSAHTKALSIVAATAKKAFEPKIAGGNAKPDVWANWADFSKRLDTLTAATADLDAAARKSGIAATTPKAFASLACKECHDKYRVPPK